MTDTHISTKAQVQNVFNIIIHNIRKNGNKQMATNKINILWYLLWLDTTQQ
jgi:hypothetical protein